MMTMQSCMLPHKDGLYIFIKSKLWKQRTVNDVTQLCVCCGRGTRTLTTKSVGRGKTLLLLGHGLAAAERAGNGSQVFTASMLTVLRVINLTVALAGGSARVTGHGASLLFI